jgi:hypothetical protein
MIGCNISKYILERAMMLGGGGNVDRVSSSKAGTRTFESSEADP